MEKSVNPGQKLNWRILALGLFLFLIIGVFCRFDNHASTIDKLKTDTLSINACGFLYLPKPYFPKEVKNADSTVLKIVGEILEQTGMHLNNDNRNFYLAQSKYADNAMALSLPIVDSKDCLFIFRYIIYNKEFLDKLGKETSPASSYVILSHEIAHHLNGDNFKVDDPAIRRQSELGADNFAGYLCYLLSLKKGFDLPACIKIYNSITDTAENDTHPNLKLRIQNFSNGWNTSKQYLTLSCQASNLLQVNPSNAILELSASNPSFVKAIKSQSIASVPNTAEVVEEIVKSNKINKTEQAVVKLRGDNMVFFQDKKNKSILSSGQIQAISKKKSSDNALMDYKNINEKVALKELILDNNSIIWARYPNGVPYIAGTIEKIK